MRELRTGCEVDLRVAEREVTKCENTLIVSSLDVYLDATNLTNFKFYFATIATFVVTGPSKLFL